MGHQTKQVLSIVKIDEREIFLDVQSDENKVTVNEVDRITSREPSQIANIIDIGDEPPLIFIRTKKKRDVVYWQKRRFLKISRKRSNLSKKNLALTACKKYI